VGVGVGVTTAHHPTDAEAKRNIVAATSGSTPASVVTTPASGTANAAGGAIANANNTGSAACAPEEED